MSKWTDICQLDDIQINMGRCALVNTKQVAIFRVNKGEDKIYAIDNQCPFSEVNNLSRGIVGSLGEHIVVAAPLYKQHFDLATGQCLEDDSVRIMTYDVRVVNGMVQLQEQLAAA